MVKTTSTRDSHSGALICFIGRVPRRDRKAVAYDPSDVDFFFIIDVEDNYYVVPLQELGGGAH